MIHFHLSFSSSLPFVPRPEEIDVEVAGFRVRFVKPILPELPRGL